MEPQSHIKQDFRLSNPIQVGTLRLRVPQDLEIDKSDNSFILTKPAAHAICTLLRKENGRNSAKVLCEFLDLILEQDLFSIRNFDNGRFTSILTPMIIFDLPDSYNDKLFSLLNSEYKDKAKKAAFILRSNVYGTAHKDPAIFLSTIIITGIKPPNLSYFSEILKRLFKKQNSIEELDAVREKLLGDVDNIFNKLGSNLKDFLETLNKYKSVVNSAANERKKKITAPDITVRTKKIRPQVSTTQGVRSKKIFSPETAQVVQNIIASDIPDKIKQNAAVVKPQIASPNLERVAAAVRKIEKRGKDIPETEPIDVVDRPSVRSSRSDSESGHSELSIKLNNLLKEPSNWGSLHPTEVMHIAVNFCKKVADKGELSRQIVTKLGIHMKKIADALKGKGIDFKIAESLLDKNFDSHNLLALLYLIDLGEPARISQTISALESEGYDKLQLKSRFSENLFRSALQIRLECQSEAPNSAASAVDTIIQLLRLPFDSDELISDS